MSNPSIPDRHKRYDYLIQTKEITGHKRKGPYSSLKKAVSAAKDVCMFECSHVDILRRERDSKGQYEHIGSVIESDY